ncbi:hypothetical protein CCAX7_45850 [Capsulimonas corticalis]|uniref:Uncharacterized protein n=1 Tax=Capsulimonas corticalis TaxID=2219043 RepID=A0A402D5T7_9BACT|nr:hypothetical protein [Capsulimonas corticalis]BDI32534.1 hypothetical protein CCAX7_45850 [Capsulimonas corticalis]
MSVPIIDVTDLYHPHQDIGDTVDLIAAYALPQIDLKAVILDCTEAFRRPRSMQAGFEDENGPRDPGVIPVEQLNYIFDRDVPYGVGPFSKMRSPDDPMLSLPRFQQRGIELILRTLRDASEPVEILSFGSARAIAAAYNREPKLFHEKVKVIRLSAGSASPDLLEWNALLDPQAIVRLLQSSLPIAIYPCAGSCSPFDDEPHNTYYKLPHRLGRGMAPKLRRYLEYAYTRSTRSDFLRAMDEDFPVGDEAHYDWEHHVWETALWLDATGSKLVERGDGSYRIVSAHDALPTDREIRQELLPCAVSVREDGGYRFTRTDQPSHFQMYFRDDPARHQTALREALPALYNSFATP